MTNSTQTRALTKSSEHSELFRREVVWIQCFHWPNTTTCGKYPCARVMPERYFVFACRNTNASISASTRKRKNFDVCACAYACVKAALVRVGSKNTCITITNENISIVSLTNQMLRYAISSLSPSLSTGCIFPAFSTFAGPWLVCHAICTGFVWSWFD